MHVMNISVEVGNDNGVPSDTLLRAVVRALSHGIIVVAAAGNSGPYAGTMSRLATIPGVISVGSADWAGTKVSQFSSRGWPMGPTTGPTVVAPGENIISDWNPLNRKSPAQEEMDQKYITLDTLRQQQSEQVYDKYDMGTLRQSLTVASGTSQACAYVTGLLGKFVELRQMFGLPHRSEDALEFLRGVAKRIPGFGGHEQGYGFVSDRYFEDYLKSIRLGDLVWNKYRFSVGSTVRVNRVYGVETVPQESLPPRESSAPPMEAKPMRIYLDVQALLELITTGRPILLSPQYKLVITDVVLRELQWLADQRPEFAELLPRVKEILSMPPFESVTLTTDEKREGFLSPNDYMMLVAQASQEQSQGSDIALSTSDAGIRMSCQARGLTVLDPRQLRDLLRASRKTQSAALDPESVRAIPTTTSELAKRVREALLWLPQLRADEQAQAWSARDDVTVPAFITEHVFDACRHLQRHAPNLTLQGLPAEEDRLTDTLQAWLSERLLKLGWHFSGQDRGGYTAVDSREGRGGVGEIDLRIMDAQRRPVCLGEALILTTPDTNKVKSHFQKLFSYSVGGFNHLFMLNWGYAADPSSTWKHYRSVVENYAPSAFPLATITDISTLVSQNVADGFFAFITEHTAGGDSARSISVVHLYVDLRHQAERDTAIQARNTVP